MQDVTITIICAAIAGVAFILFVITAVIIGEFLASPNILDSHNPDRVAV